MDLSEVPWGNGIAPNWGRHCPKFVGLTGLWPWLYATKRATCVFLVSRVGVTSRQ